MDNVYINGINSVIMAIPSRERDMFIDMLDSFNPLEGIEKLYLIPIEMYCDKCGIQFRGYEGENIKSSLERLDIRITQKKDGKIDINDKYGCIWHLLNHLEIDWNTDIIKYSFHKRLSPYIMAYHIMKQGGI